MRVSFSGRTVASQATNGSSILPTRTKNNGVNAEHLRSVFLQGKENRTEAARSPREVRARKPPSGGRGSFVFWRRSRTKYLRAVTDSPYPHQK